MIPGSGDYPSASAVDVTAFISKRVNPAELEALERLCDQVDPTTDEREVSTWVHELQSANPADFELLRYLVYTAYYRAPEVIAVLNSRGFDYHGAPQPYGYDVAQDIPLPKHTRGSFISTDAVRNVFD
jgi:hypothetical protein